MKLKDPIRYYERKLIQSVTSEKARRQLAKRPVNDMPYMMTALTKIALGRAKV